MTSTTTITTATPCPDWCSVDHTEDPGPGGFHAGATIQLGATAARLWQVDRDGAPAGIVVGGELLSDGEAHEAGMALVRAADQLRRARIGQR